MNISDQTLAIFDSVGMWEGFSALANERVSKALSEMLSKRSDESLEIERCKEEMRVWTKDVPNVEKQVKAFSARMAIIRASTADQK